MRIMQPIVVLGVRTRARTSGGCSNYVSRGAAGMVRCHRKAAAEVLGLNGALVCRSHAADFPKAKLKFLRT